MSSSWNSWFQNQREAVTQVLDKTGDVLSKAASSAAKKQQQQQQQSSQQSQQPLDAQRQQQQNEAPFHTDPSTTTHNNNTNNNNNNNNIFSSLTHMMDHTRAVIEQEQSKLLSSITAFTHNSNSSKNAFSLLHERPVDWPLDVDALRDLEVVYLTNRIITCSHPYLDSANYNMDDNNNDGMMVISAERKIQALSHLLRQRHDGKYMIWNLSEVNNYQTTSLQYFDDQVLTFSFPGSPSPPLGLLLKLVVSMESWLQADPEHVIVVHCLTGRGRSSLAVASLFCWTGEAQFTTSVPMALDYIAQCKQIQQQQNQQDDQNEENNGNEQQQSQPPQASDTPNTTTTTTKEEDELTIPSQRRYGTYFTNMMEGIRPFQPPLILKRIILSQAPKFCRDPRPLKQVDEQGGGENNGGGAPNDEETEQNKSSADHKKTNKRSMGCAPYLQIFKAGQLIFTTTPSIHHAQQQQQQQQQQPRSAQAQQQQQQAAAPDLPFISVADGPISFLVDVLVQGDVLIRCRHVVPSSKTRVSMFRAAFHTGYVPTPILRLKKSELDGACHDRRFDDTDFYVDVIFEPVQAETASQHLMSFHEQQESNSVTSSSGGGGGSVTNDNKDDSTIASLPPMTTTTQSPTETTTTTTASDIGATPTIAIIPPLESQNEARERRERATLAGHAAAAVAAATTAFKKKRDTNTSSAATATNATVTATAYDSMLHRDSRFWDVISAKREKRQQQQAAAAAAAATSTDKEGPAEEDLKFWGPTIGRRRDFNQSNANTNSGGNNNKSNTNSGTTSGANSSFALSTPFSIGGEFDFLPSLSPTRTSSTKSPKKPKEADSLMDALNALDNDDDGILFPSLEPNAADNSAGANVDNDKEDMEEIIFETATTETEPAATTLSSKTPPQSPPLGDTLPTVVVVSPPVEATMVALNDDGGVSTEPKSAVVQESATAAATATTASMATTITTATATNTTSSETSAPPPLASAKYDNVDDLLKDDTDMDALLASGDEDEMDLNNLDGLENDDDDDAELEDLEKFLSQK